MAKTPAQRQREYMERKKEQQKQASLAQAAAFKTPFFKFWKDAQHQDEFDIPLGLAGVAAPRFDNDDPPEKFVLDHVTDLDDPFGRLESGSRQGSLPRAEIMLDLLLDAARIVAGALHDYKGTEIKARLAEIEASDLSDPAKKKAALKEATRLNKMLDQLGKQVRWTFPQWKVTG